MSRRVIDRRGFLRVAAARRSAHVSHIPPLRPPLPSSGSCTSARFRRAASRSIVGCGTWRTFDVGDDAARRRELTEVLRVLFAAGGCSVRFIADVRVVRSRRGRAARGHARARQGLRRDQGLDLGSRGRHRANGGIAALLRPGRGVARIDLMRSTICSKASKRCARSPLNAIDLGVACAQPSTGRASSRPISYGASTFSASRPSARILPMLTAAIGLPPSRSIRRSGSRNTPSATSRARASRRPHRANAPRPGQVRAARSRRRTPHPALARRRSACSRALRTRPKSRSSIWRVAIRHGAAV